MTKYLLAASIVIGVGFLMIPTTEVKPGAVTVVCNEIVAVPKWGVTLTSYERELVVKDGYGKEQVIPVPNAWALRTPKVGQKYVFTYREGVLSFIDQQSWCQ